MIKMVSFVILKFHLLVFKYDHIYLYLDLIYLYHNLILFNSIETEISNFIYIFLIN